MFRSHPFRRQSLSGTTSKENTFQHLSRFLRGTFSVHRGSLSERGARPDATCAREGMNDLTEPRSSRRLALFRTIETPGGNSDNGPMGRGRVFAMNFAQTFPPVRAKTATISGFLRRRAKRDWASRGHPVRRIATLGNGAVAHRACVTLLRAYNHPRVSLSPVPRVAGAVSLVYLCSIARIFFVVLRRGWRRSSTFRGARRTPKWPPFGGVNRG